MSELYADIFTREFDENKSITDITFDKFLAYQLEHLTVQWNIAWGSQITSQEFDSFNYLFTEWYLDPTLAQQLIEKTATITKTMKWSWNHGDHNQYNIFENGVIDLEDSFYGPIWYDTITSLSQNFWFPDPIKWEVWEFMRQHSFSKTQLKTYFTEIQKNTLWIDFMNSDIFGALFLMRAVFVTVKTDGLPLLRKYRYNKLTHAVQAYLKGENMINYFISLY